METISSVLFPFCSGLIFLSALTLAGPANAAIQVNSVHVPQKLISRAIHLGRKAPDESMKLSVVLSLKDSAGLADFLARVQDPNDPLYHKFLSPEEFAQRFAPSEREVRQVVDSLQRSGLQVSQVHNNHFVLNVAGNTAAVEHALQLELHNYLAPNGQIAFAATSEPITKIPGINAIVGLDSFTERRTHLRQGKKLSAKSLGSNASVSSYITPAKIKSAYNLNSVASTGAGETLALFELDGYVASDVNAYASYFSLPAPKLQNILVDGFNGSSGDGAGEVTLDIELALALAPGLSKILVYEGPNTDSGVIDTYSRIANDNLAREVSTSWGAPEGGSSSAFLNAENSIFQQMASQGQSIFAAAGDSGAYDDQNSPGVLAVDDPSSQPYVTGVGGTTLRLNADSTYQSESTWGGAGGSSGGGGGISKIWSVPSWQSGLTINSMSSVSTKRTVPDVSLNSDPNTGYAIYFQGGWNVFGGTSCAAPLWAAFTALVNSSRIARNSNSLGFINPRIYQLGKSTDYNLAFHDIADGSTNLHYPAVLNYDLATGWGTFNGAQLYNSLLSDASPVTVSAPGAPTNFEVKVQ